MGWRKATLSALGATFAALAAVAPTAGAAIAQPDVDYDLGSPVTPPRLNQLDVYRPDGSAAMDSRPVVVYVHGGGWRAGDKGNSITDKVDLFTGAGYVFVSLNYRLSPNPTDTSYPPGRVRFPDHPDDVGEAIGWIDRNIAAFGGDPKRLLLIGHSAGAHLVSLVSTDPRYVTAYGVEPWQLAGTVALDGDAYDVADRISEVPAGTKPLFYSAFGTPQENAAEGTWAAASPLLHAGPRDPDHLIVTQAAAPGRIADAEALAAALGQDPSATVFRAPYDHEGINGAVGDPADGSGETTAIIDFFAGRAAAAREPRARITRHPAKRVRTKPGRRKAKVRFAFVSSVSGSRFECSLGDRAFDPCRSPHRLRLGAGSYRFRVRPLGPTGRPGDAMAFRFRVSRRR